MLHSLLLRFYALILPCHQGFPVRLLALTLTSSHLNKLSRTFIKRKSNKDEQDKQDYSNHIMNILTILVKNMNSNNKAVILLSGGIDSSTTLAVARKRGFELYALTIRYGQRHKIEIEAARKIARVLQVMRHEIVNIDMSIFGGSALTDNIDVPKRRLKDSSDIVFKTPPESPPTSVGGEVNDIPVTYVPARNIIMLSVALGWAESIGARHIFIGVNAVDYSGYPDCRTEFIAAFERLANLATRAGVEGREFKIEAPLIDMTKAEIISLGTSLGLDYGLTHSCYDPLPDGFACGICDSCIIRRRGFAKAGIPDPAKYPAGVEKPDE